MPYLDCPNCHLELHSGLIYERPDACPRCGSPLQAPAPALRRRLSAIGFWRRTRTAAVPDWEQITRAQYGDRRFVARAEPRKSDEAGTR